MINPWAIAAGVGALAVVAGRRRRQPAPAVTARLGLASVPAPAAMAIAGWPGWYMLRPDMVLTPLGCVHVALSPAEMVVRGYKDVYPGGWMMGAKPEPKPPAGTVWAAPLTSACFVAGAGLKPGFAHMVAQLAGAVNAIAASTGALKGDVEAAIKANAPSLGPLLALGDQLLASTPVGSVAGYAEALAGAADKAGIPTASVKEWVENPQKAIQAAAALAAAKAGL